MSFQEWKQYQKERQGAGEWKQIGQKAGWKCFTYCC